MRGRLVIAAAVGMFMSASLSAHHGRAAYDNGKVVILKGAVVQWVYSNPHCLLTVDVKGDDGSVVRWIAETQAPNIMYPAGYRKDSFKVGDEVTVNVEPVKNGQPIGRILKAVLANGTTLGFVNDVPIPAPGR